MTDSRRAPAHAWKAGQSGNPKGRPVGTGEVAKLRSAISDHVPQIVDALLSKALDGDVSAARLLLERTVPALKPAEHAQAIALPQGSLTDQGRALMALVASGELNPQQGATLVSAVGTLARVAEVDELAMRVATLEERLHAKP